MNADGTNQTRLTNNPASDGLPAWSPDGTKIAFATDRDSGPGNLEIYSMNADGTNQTRLTNNPAADEEPAWSPDGTKISFRTNRDDGNYDIYTINPDGTNPTRLTNDPSAGRSRATHGRTNGGHDYRRRVRFNARNPLGPTVPAS
jgi:TolB protein